MHLHWSVSILEEAHLLPSRIPSNTSRLLPLLSSTSHISLLMITLIAKGPTPAISQEEPKNGRSKPSKVVKGWSFLRQALRTPPFWYQR